MAQERIELRFSPGNPNERALIDALNALGDEYGAKGRFLKERLLKGYTAILNELEGFMREGDPMAALDHFAPTVDSKHYRVLKVLLSSRLDVNGEARPQQLAAPAPKPVAPVPAQPVVEVPNEQTARPVVAPAEVPAQPPAPVTSTLVEAAVVPAVDAVAAQVMAQAPAPVAQPEPQASVQLPEQASEPDAAPVDAAEALAEQPASPPARKHDWSAFAGIAGAKKGG